MAKFAAAHWIAEGSGKRILYVFVDPNCPYCRNLFDALQPEIKPRDLQVRFIVVGYLTSTSQGKAGAILAAKDPLAALRYNERNFGRTAPGGGIDETLPSDKTIAALDKNYRLLMSTGSSGVPAMVVLDRRQGPRLVEGAPDAKDLRKILDDLR
ncbi:MAG: thioredoxin fold domain-containing protein [Gammaproteobacteria bacterium]|nr:thioredoxin fold domain-containing protein [Gammaproteobacteria bacterium]